MKTVTMYVSIKNHQSKIKNCLLLFLMLWLVPDVFGQTPQKVSYMYDAAGNRTLRTKIISMTKSSFNEVGQDTGSTSATVIAEVRHEDLLGERKVMIYPNPTQGLLRIEYQGDSELKDARLLLYDRNGRLLRQINKAELSQTLDLTLLPAGTYILQIIEATAKSEWKIVKD